MYLPPPPPPPRTTTTTATANRARDSAGTGTFRAYAPRRDAATAIADAFCRRAATRHVYSLLDSRTPPACLRHVYDLRVNGLPAESPPGSLDRSPP